MIEKIKALCVKYRELIVYILVGGITTVIAWGCKFLFNILVFGSPALPTLAQNSVLSAVENISGILAAYPLNRKWVFRSSNPRIFAEFVAFAGSRLATWGMSWLLNLLMVNTLHISVYISTVVVGILVVIGNYVISKLFVFKKKTDA